MFSFYTPLKKIPAWKVTLGEMQFLVKGNARLKVIQCGRLEGIHLILGGRFFQVEWHDVMALKKTTGK